jgi:hypothetical protein|eukprot:scaffold2612_cov267-Chaetoceros_neogracile.AAC.57
MSSLWLQNKTTFKNSANTIILDWPTYLLTLPFTKFIIASFTMLAASRISSRCIKTTIARSRPLHSSTKLLSKEPPKSAAKASPPKKAEPDLSKDPHVLAEEMVRNSSDSRIAGTEALESLTSEQKYKNYAGAVGLMSFCIGVWYYSIQAVGQSDSGMNDLRSEAQEAKDVRDMKSAQEMNAQDLAQIDGTMAQYGDDADDMVVAVAAPDSIAQQEEDALNAGKKKVGRPLWKKIVLFWKKE